MAVILFLFLFFYFFSFSGNPPVSNSMGKIRGPAKEPCQSESGTEMTSWLRKDKLITQMGGLILAMGIQGKDCTPVCVGPDLLSFLLLHLFRSVSTI